MDIHGSFQAIDVQPTFDRATRGIGFKHGPSSDANPLRVRAITDQEQGGLS